MTISRGTSPKMGRSSRKRAIWEISLEERVTLVECQRGGRTIKVVRLNGRVALDAGNTLLDRRAKSGRPLQVEEFPTKSRLFKLARQAVRLLVLLFGAENVFIIKNETPRRLGKETFDTLDRLKFFASSVTGFRRENYRLTKFYARKGPACRRLGIDFMVDDRARVGCTLPSRTYFLHYGEPATREAKRWSNAIAKRVIRGTLKYSRVHDWSEVMREILHFYPVSLKDILRGRSQEEEADIVALYATLFESE